MLLSVLLSTLPGKTIWGSNIILNIVIIVILLTISSFQYIVILDNIATNSAARLQRSKIQNVQHKACDKLF